MESKLLRTIRKYYGYKFLIGLDGILDGRVAVRCKKSGTVKVYDTIEDYVRNVSYADIFINVALSHKWNKKKQIISDKKITKNQNYWNSL